MQIHALYVMRDCGVCIYQKNYSNELKSRDIDLITPFFAAISDFSKILLYKEIEVLEMSNLRFTFKKKEDLIFILLSESSENAIYLDSCLNKVIETFMAFYKNAKSNFDESEIIEDRLLEGKIDTLIKGEDVFMKLKENGLYNKIDSVFHNLIDENDVYGAAILTTNGSVLYSSLSEKILKRSLRELEIAITLANKERSEELPELLYVLNNGQKICERLIKIEEHDLDLLIIMHFRSNSNLGMVEWNAEKFTTAIQTIA